MKPALRAVALALVLVASLPLAVAHGATDVLPATPLLPASAPSVVPVTLGELPHRVLPSPFAGPDLGPAAPSSYRLNFTCPSSLLATQFFPCPNRIVDTDDLLGNPSLAVDPLFPEHMAFASLHGTAANGPSNLSRGRQPHTVHTTTLAGADWRDQPYGEPNPPGGRNRMVVGEDTAAIMDSVGNLYVASLYAWRDRNDDNGTWAYSIAQWKFDSTADILTYAFPNAVFDNRAPGTVISRPYLLELPEVRKILLLWQENAPVGVNVTVAGRAMSGWLGGATTLADAVSPWSKLDDKFAIGPCANLTNPVAYRAKVYVGCEAAGGFTAMAGVAPGDVVLHELDTEKGLVRVVSKTPIRGDARLAVDEGGRLALVAVKVTSPVSVKAQVTTSNLGEGWTRPYEFGDQLHNASLGVKTARVNALLYRGQSNVLHMVYLEENARLEGQPRTVGWRKALVAVDPIGTVLVNKDLKISDKGEVFGSRRSRSNEAPYGDTRDTLLKVGEREFIAFNDYAVIVVAEILEHDEREPLQPNGIDPPPPEPVPAVEVSVVNVGVGVVAGATAAEAIRRIAAQRLAHLDGSGRGK